MIREIKARVVVVSRSVVSVAAYARASPRSTILQRCSFKDESSACVHIARDIDRRRPRTPSTAGSTCRTHKLISILQPLDPVYHTRARSLKVVTGQGFHFTMATLYDRLVKKKRKKGCNGPSTRNIKGQVSLSRFEHFPAKRRRRCSRPLGVRRWNFSLLFYDAFHEYPRPGLCGPSATDICTGCLTQAAPNERKMFKIRQTDKNYRNNFTNNHIKFRVINENTRVKN